MTDVEDILKEVCRTWCQTISWTREALHPVPNHNDYPGRIAACGAIGLEVDQDACLGLVYALLRCCLCLVTFGVSEQQRAKFDIAILFTLSIDEVVGTYRSLPTNADPIQLLLMLDSVFASPSTSNMTYTFQIV